MTVPKPDETDSSIDTQSGAVVGGDFVGRDQYKFSGSPEHARWVKNWQVMEDKFYTGIASFVIGRSSTVSVTTSAPIRRTIQRVQSAVVQS